jgi:hypothetical protein
MNTSTIERIIQSNSVTRNTFIGVYPIDLLPTVDNYPCYVIVNTTTSDKNYGHWILLYIKCEKEAIFFDSYGRKPSLVNNGQLFNDYLSKFNVTYNKHVLQSRYSNVCGYYCIYVAYFLCQNISFSRMKSIFCKNVDYNDMLVVDMINSIFNLHDHLFI